MLPPNLYIEISPSGNGFRFFIAGNKKRTKCKRVLPDGGKIELYDCDRFLTVTGNRYGDGNKVVFAPEVIHRIEEEWLDQQGEAEEDMHKPNNYDVPNEELLDKMFSSKNGAAIKKLWDGDIEKYDGDDSAADQALLCHLAFWTNKHPEHMEDLFDESALGQRDKWRNREDYRKRSIKNAINTIKNGYDATNGDLDRLLSEYELQAFQGRIRLIDPKISRKQLPTELKGILADLSKVNQAQAMAILKEDLKTHFGFTDKELEPYTKQMKETRKQMRTESTEMPLSADEALAQLKNVKQNQKIHPALDFIGGVMYFGVKVNEQLFLISSEGKFINTSGGS
jgi:hypothetical protein